MLEERRDRELALGAIRQALSCAELVPEDHRVGLYAGWPGIAHAATRIGVLLDDASLVDDARRLAEDAPDPDAPSLDFDLVSGRAGAIVALLVMSRVLDDDSLLERAVRHGEALVRSAEPREEGLAWASRGLPAQPCLTGLSHGAAGAGYALLELAAETGIAGFRTSAELAFAYERSWFDAEEGNWPDLRDERRRSPGTGYPPPCLVFWCHGAPGIALSRLRAAELLADDGLGREALVALDTTRASLADAVDTGIGNFSLCHGIAGNADVLLHAGRTGAATGSSDLQLLAAVAELGAERYARPGSAWPSGTHGAETPSLMLGLAGIGSFYLRMSDPTVPSVLAIAPREHALAAEHATASQALIIPSG